MCSSIPEQTLKSILADLTTEDYVFFETSKPDKNDKQSLLFTKPVAEINYSTTDNAAVFFEKIQQYLDDGFYIAGWFAYEFGCMLEPALHHCLNAAPGVTLAHLGVFTPPLKYEHDLQKFDHAPSFSGNSASTAKDNTYCIENLRPSQTEEQFKKNIARIKEYITSGDTYQVNYTLKMLFDFKGSPQELYRTLRRNQPVAYSAYLQMGDKKVLSFSPELFFKIRAGICSVRPMKGTMPRGRTMKEDLQRAAFLQQDIKNRSENIMIVDLLRNDLGRLCEMGSVHTRSLFDIETYSTLHQMTSTIDGHLRAQTSLLDIFKAMFPCGSVTGAPKIRTMEIINELESKPRGIYTGAIGYLSPNGDAAFNVPIRTIVLQGHKGEMGIGAGIVHDSEPEGEWQESLLKGRFLTHPKPPFALIETILWNADSGQYWLLDLHLQRLADSAKFFAFPLEIPDIGKELHKLSAGFSADTQSFRVRVLCEVNGQFSISTTPCLPPAIIDLPILTQKKSPLKITISNKATNSENQMLFHKTTDREFYNTARHKALEQEYFEVLFMNEKQEITEGSISNIMIRQGSTFYTPPVNCGLLGGICRQHLLKTHPKRLQEKIINRNDLKAADAVYIMNSVRGVVEVTIK